MELPADEAEHVVQHVIRYLPDDFYNPIGYLIKSINNRRSGM